MKYRWPTILMFACSLPLCVRAAVSDTSRTGVVIIRPSVSAAGSRFPQLIPRGPAKLPRIALVLSGGGARGIASVGVLKAFETYDIPIDLIVGTSIGSIVGGLYAAGYTTHDLHELVDTTDWAEVLSYADEARRSEMFLDQKIMKEQSIMVLRFKGFEPIIPSSFSTGQRLTNYLNILSLQGIYHPNPSFDDLRIPFRAVTTDLVSGKQFVFDRGDLGEAMRASVSVPLLFSPVKRDTMELLDGGLLANLPVDVARENGADVVIAVDVSSPLRPATMLRAPWEVGDQIMGIMMQEGNKIARKKADFVLTPDLGNHISSDFTNLDTLIARGRESVEKNLPALRALLDARTDRWFQQQTKRSYPNLRMEYQRILLSADFIDRIDRLQQKPEVSEAEIEHLVTDIYDNGDFSDVWAEVRPDSERTFIRWTMIPNPILKSVEFVGTKVMPTDSLAKVFKPLIGLPINAKRIKRAMELILSEYREQGYSLTRIRDAKFDSTSGKATFTMDEGVIYRIDIKGTEKTRDYVVWRELPFAEQDVFQVSKVVEGISNLYGTGLFEQLSVTLHQEGDKHQLQVVTINARERSTELIRLGLRVDNERNIQPSIDLRDENFLGTGSELGVRAAGGPRNQSYIAEFKVTRIFDSYLTFGVKGYSLTKDVNFWETEPSPDPLHYNRIRTGEYRQVREGGSVTIGTQLQRLGTFTIEGRLEHHNVYSIFNSPVPDEDYTISSVRFGTRLDTQDKYPYPTRGETMNFTYESALYKVGNAVGFTKFVFSYDQYRTFFQTHTLHPRFTLGLGDEVVPLSEQFSFGGQNNFYGLREDDSRGRQIFIASLEYRYKLPIKILFDTYFTMRYDLGSIWAKPEEVRLIDLQHGIGFGFAFDTPIGPAEFALGRSFKQLKQFLDRPVSLGPMIGYFSIGYPLP